MLNQWMASETTKKRTASERATLVARTNPQPKDQHDTSLRPANALRVFVLQFGMAPPSIFRRLSEQDTFLCKLG